MPVKSKAWIQSQSPKVSTRFRLVLLETRLG